MLRGKIALGLFILMYIFTIALAYGQTELKPLHERPIISVVGRLALEKHAEEKWLVLHAKNAETYLITGDLIEKLKNTLLELKENNLVFVTGNQDGRSNVSCEQSSKYEYNEKGQKELKIDAKCIRYYYLEVTQILSAKKSDEKIPPPKRDTKEEEKFAQGTTEAGQCSLTQPIIGEIYGKISSINLKSPVKTLKIVNRDKASLLKKITLVISQNTRVVKKIGQEEPIALMPQALKAGQEITAAYSRDEFKAEALFITITKE